MFNRPPFPTAPPLEAACCTEADDPCCGERDAYYRQPPTGYNEVEEDDNERAFWDGKEDSGVYAPW